MIRMRTALLILFLIALAGCIYSWTAWPFYHGLWQGHMEVNGKEGPAATLHIRHEMWGDRHMYISYDVPEVRESGDEALRQLLGGLSSTECRYDIPDRPLDHPERKVSYRFTDVVDTKTCGRMIMQFEDHETLGVQLRSGAVLKLKRRPTRDPILNYIQEGKYVETIGQVPKQFIKR